MIQTHLRDHRLKLYAAALLCGLFVGGMILFMRHFAEDTDGGANCKTESGQQAALVDAAKGDVAAFIVSDNIQPMPDFIFKDTVERQLKLSDFRDKVLLINLWATWCLPCREEMPALDKLQEKRQREGFSVLAVSLDSDSEKPKQFYRDNKIEALALYHDDKGEAFRQLRRAGLVQGLPTSFLVNKNGCLLGLMHGPANWAGHDAKALIDAASSSQYQ